MHQSQQNPYQVFHSPCEQLRKRIHVVLVRPEEPGNVGAIARALENMGILGEYRIVGSPDCLTEKSRRRAKNAQKRLESIRFFNSLEEARTLHFGKSLSFGATARIGSAERPHPTWVRPACESAVSKLRSGEIEDLVLVMGPEGSGLANDEIAQCDWVVTIPSVSNYRSLNLAQSVLIFGYELNMGLLAPQPTFVGPGVSQRERLITHLLRLAEDAGFILPKDPYKMRPRLERIFSRLPKHIEEASTLHGLIDQVRRSVQRGEPDMKGRYRQRLNKQAEPGQVR